MVINLQYSADNISGKKFNWDMQKGLFQNIKDKIYITPTNEQLNLLEKYNKLVKECSPNIEKWKTSLPDSEIKAYFNSLDGGIATQKSMTIALNQSTVASKAAALGMKALSMAGNMIIMWAVSEAIRFAVEGIQALVEADERAIQKADDLKKAFQEQSDSITSNKKTLQDLKSEFETLSKGVDTYGNNISLSTDEYARYKEIVQQIVSISPTLSQGYDAEGNAIANKNSLLERAIELQDTEYKNYLRKASAINNVSDLINGDSAIYNQANSSLRHGKSDLTRTLYASFNAEKAGVTQAEKAAKQIAQTLGISIQEYFDSAYGMIDTSKFMDENIKNIAYQIEDVVKGLTPENTGLSENELKNQIQLIESAAENYRNLYQESNNAYNAIVNNLQVFANASEEYQDLTSQQKTLVGNWIGNTEVESVMSNNWLTDKLEADEGKIIQYRSHVNDVISSLNNLSDNDKKSIDAVSSLTESFSEGSKTLSQYEEQVNSVTNSLISLISNNPDLKKALGYENLSNEEIAVEVKVDFGYDDVNSQLDKLKTEIQKSLGDNELSQNLFGNFDLNQLKTIQQQIAAFGSDTAKANEYVQQMLDFNFDTTIKDKVAELDQQVSDGSISYVERTERLKEFASELKLSGDALEWFLGLFKKEADESQSLDAILKASESDLQTYKDALDKLNSGKLSDDDLIKLAQIDPDLLKDVDDTAQGLENLKRNLQEASEISLQRTISELKDYKASLVDEEEINRVETLIDLLTKKQGNISGKIDFSGLDGQESAFEATNDAMKDTLSTLERFNSEYQKLASVNDIVKDGFKVTAEEALKMAQMYPEILSNAKVANDGKIQLDKEAIQSVRDRVAEELTTEIDGKIEDLKAHKAELEAKKAATQLACAAMAGDHNELNRVVSVVANDSSGNIDKAAVLMADTIYNNVQNAKQSMNSLTMQAHETAKAIEGAGHGVATGAVGLIGGAVKGVSKGGTNTTNSESAAFKNGLNDLKYLGKDLGNSFESQLKLDIAGYDKAIASIDGQIAALENSKSIADKLAQGMGTNKGSGKKGSGSKKEEDTWLKAFEKELKDLQYLRDTNEISKAEYYNRLEKLNIKYFKNKEKYLDEYRKYYVEVLQWRLKAYQEFLNNKANKMKSAYDAAMKIVDRETEALEKQKEQVEEFYNTKIDAIQDEIDILKKRNDEENREIEIEKARQALEAAKRNKTALVFHEGQGWIQETKQSDIDDAQKKLDDLLLDKTISDKENQIDDLEKQRDEITENIDKQIDNLKELKDQWAEALDIADLSMNYKEMLSTIGDFENMSYTERLNALKKFSDEYRAIQEELYKINSADTIEDISEIGGNISFDSNGNITTKSTTPQAVSNNINPPIIPESNSISEFLKNYGVINSGMLNSMNVMENILSEKLEKSVIPSYVPTVQNSDTTTVKIDNLIVKPPKDYDTERWLKSLTFMTKNNTI